MANEENTKTDVTVEVKTKEVKNSAEPKIKITKAETAVPVQAVTEAKILGAQKAKASKQRTDFSRLVPATQTVNNNKFKGGLSFVDGELVDAYGTPVEVEFDEDEDEE